MKNPIMVLSWMVAALLPVAAGCSVSDGGSRRIEGSGRTVTEERPLPAFQGVDLQGEGRLIIGPNEPAVLQVRTDDNLAALVETEVVDGRLVIGTRPDTDLDPSDGVTYRVACDQVSDVHLSGSGEIDLKGCQISDLIIGLDGSGNVRVAGVDATRVDAEIGGSGTITATGRSDQISASLAGSGTFDGIGLRGEKVAATIPGSGQILVWATDTLDVTISGSGSVSYRGDPTVKRHISGTGSVNQDSAG